jgi:hypothetical protein
MLLFEQVEQVLKRDIEKLFERKSYIFNSNLEADFLYSFQFCIFYILNIPRILFLRWFHTQKLFYFQDLNKIDSGLPLTVNKRIRLRFEEETNQCIELSFSLPARRKQPSIIFFFGGEDSEIGVRMNLCLFSFSFVLEEYFKFDRWDLKEYGISFFEEYIFFYTGKENAKLFNIPDFFLGERDYKSEVVTSDAVLIGGFEDDSDSYPCVIEIRRDTWTRPRLKAFPLVIHRCHMNSSLGIPQGSKWGSNDKLHGYTFHCPDVGTAVREIRKSVEETRKIHGWEVIQPNKLHIAKMGIDFSVVSDV